MNRWLRVLAFLAGAVLTACGSNQATRPTSSPDAGGAVHVRSATAILSYAISPETGRLTPAGGVADGLWGHLATDPDGRFVFTASSSRIHSYAVNPQGGLESRTDLPFVSALARRTDCAGSGSVSSSSPLSASRQYVYMLTSCNVHSLTWYAVDVFAVAADGRLTAQGSVPLGHDHLLAGPALLADPSGRVVYREKRWDGLIAQAVQPDGTLGSPVGELRFFEWEHFSGMHLIRGFLIVASGDHDALASLAVDEGTGVLQLRSDLRAAGPFRIFVHPFGPAGLLLGRYEWPLRQPKRYEDVVTFYEVGPAGELAPRRAVADPQHYYAEPRLRFHRSWAFAYGLSDAGGGTLRAFAVAADGQLTLTQEIGQPASHIVVTPPSF